MAINTVALMENMPDPGQAFAQAFQQAQQQRALQQQQLQAQSRQQQYQQFVQRLRTDRSPETMSEFMLAFPEQADAITKAFEPLDQAKKQSQIGFYGQALSALDRGDVETAKQVVQSRLEAARNTIGAEQEAAELEYGLSLLDSNPDALRDGLASAVFTLDPKRYEALYANKGLNLDTAIIKNLVAEGFEVGSPEFKEEMRKERSKVTVTLPGGGFFSGPADELKQMLGGTLPPDAQRGPIPSPKSKAEFDALPAGAKFKAPDGTIRTKPGGGSSNATGGFRSQGVGR